MSEVLSEISRNMSESFSPNLYPPKLDKCKILNITKGILAPSEDVTLVSDEKIQALDIREQYKYLGMVQSNEINKKKMKQKYREEYFNRVKKS